MNGHVFTLAGTSLTALPSGALFLPSEGALCVSDLHLGKSERMARRGAPLLPPYETTETLTRLRDDLALTGARLVICLGDSFDDSAAAEALPEAAHLALAGLQAGRRWIWIAGNHDPGPTELAGTHLGELRLAGLTFRHEARAAGTESGEVSGHYHPKFGLPGMGPARRAFLFDQTRLILPAYGAYTGGLSARATELRSLLAPRAFAVLCGRKAIFCPLPP